MRITVRHHDPYPLTFAIAAGAACGRADDGAAARAAAEAAREARRDGARPLTLSLSHRDGRGAAVLAPAGVRAGIDLERTRQVSPGQERFFATAAERRARGRPRDGAVLWALKEAAWKAFRCPPTLPLKGLELELDRVGGVVAVRVEGRRHPARSRLRRPWPGWVLALVWVEDPS